MRNFKTDMWTSLGDVFLISDQYEQTQVTVGIAACMVLEVKKAGRASHVEQVSKQHSLVASTSVPASVFLLPSVPRTCFDGL